MVLFAISPALLGVPHVASDVRYLVLRPRLPRALVAWLALGCVALFATRLVSRLHVTSRDLYSLEIAVGSVLVFVAALLGVARSRSRWRALLVLTATIAIALIAARAPRTALLVFAYLHNVVGVVLGVLYFPRRASAILPLLLGVLALALLFAVGASYQSSTAFGLSIADVATYLAPGMPLRAAASLVLVYIFLQALHYAVWLAWIPFVARDSTHSLRHDFRGLGLAFIALAMIVVAVASVRDVHATRDLYLSLAAFHAYLELMLLAYWSA